MKEWGGGRCGSGIGSVARGYRLPFLRSDKSMGQLVGVGTEHLWQVSSPAIRLCLGCDTFYQGA